MKEKSDIEILQDYAKSTHRSIEVTEIPYPRTGIRSTQKFRRAVFMPNDARKTSFFVWFNDPYTKTIGQTVIFSGAFIPLSSRIKSRLEIRNRFILDKLNFFSKSKSNKTGNGAFDSKATILGDFDGAAKRLLLRADIQKQILLALDIRPHYHVSINQPQIDFVPELKGSATFSVLNAHGWEMDTDHIESIFKRIEKIADIIHVK